MTAKSRARKRKKKNHVSTQAPAAPSESTSALHKVRIIGISIDDHGLGSFEVEERSHPEEAVRSEEAPDVPTPS